MREIPDNKTILTVILILVYLHTVFILLLKMTVRKMVCTYWHIIQHGVIYSTAFLWCTVFLLHWSMLATNAHIHYITQQDPSILKHFVQYIMLHFQKLIKCISCKALFWRSAYFPQSKLLGKSNWGPIILYIIMWTKIDDWR